MGRGEGGRVWLWLYYVAPCHCDCMRWRGEGGGERGQGRREATGAESRQPQMHPYPSVPSPHRIFDGQGAGLHIFHHGSRGVLEDCQIWGNRGAGIWLGGGTQGSTLARCTIRDHVGGWAFHGAGRGIYSSDGSRMTVGEGNVFERNALGDVVQQ